MFKNIKERVKKFVKENKKVLGLGLTLGITTMGSIASATGPNTGNTDLDTIISSMDSGIASMKAGGLYIIGAVIVVAVTFFGARWLWNMFRGWMARAQ